MRNLFLVGVLAVLTLFLLALPMVSATPDASVELNQQCDPEGTENGQCYCIQDANGNCVVSTTQNVKPSSNISPRVTPNQGWVPKWGPMWYLRGRAVYDPVTIVKGAPEG